MIEKESEYNKYGYGNCGMCGGALIWQSDFDSEDFGYDKPGIVSIAICSECRAEVQTTKIFEEMEGEENE